MALLKYFKKATVQPNPEGPLSDRMPSAAISAANKEVKELVVSECDASGSNLPTRKPRGQYRTKRKLESPKGQQNLE